jgi:hypothetical protein
MLWSSAFLILILNKKQIQDSSDSIRWIYSAAYAHSRLPFTLIFSLYFEGSRYKQQLEW